MSSKTSFWGDVEAGPPDKIFGLIDAFEKDGNPKKVNLGIGVYRDGEGSPIVLRTVRKAEEIIKSKSLFKEYLPIVGDEEFCTLAVDLALGKNNQVTKNKLNCTVQTISGTGALRVGSTFLQKHFPGHKTIYVSDPSWPNHIPIFTTSGLEIKTYKYYNPKTYGLDLFGLLQSIQNIPEKSIIFFQASCHNPTGVDPNPEEWAAISKACKARQLFPFFDLVYQGFASGDLDKDAEGLRIFLRDGHEFAIAQSFAKNMGLYGERVGTFSLICKSTQVAEKCLSQIKLVIRPMYSNPPINGSRIAKEILSNPEIYEEWKKEIWELWDRVTQMRILFREELAKCGSKLDWSHVTRHVGWFCYTGLTREQVQRLRSEFSIFMTEDGRVPIVQMNPKNVQYLADAFHQVTK